MEHGSGVGPATGIDTQAEDVVRVLAGLQPGRIVNYVMKGGDIRPLLLIRVIDPTGVIAGVLFFDGTRDNGLFPITLGNVKTLDAYERTHCIEWVAQTSFDDEGDLEGTWHWPSRQPVVASGVDAAVIETLRAELTASFNAKLAATVDSLKQMLDTKDNVGKAIEEGTYEAQNSDPLPSPPLPTMAVPNLAEAKPDSEVVDGRKVASEEKAKTAVGGSQG